MLPFQSFTYFIKILFFPAHIHTHKFSHFNYYSIGTESACDTGDPSSIPGMGRSAGEGGYLLQYSWASLVKNLPAMWETPV